MINLYNLWLIFSVGVIAGMGIYAGWHFAKAIVTGLSRGYDWLEAKVLSAKKRQGERIEDHEQENP